MGDIQVNSTSVETNKTFVWYGLGIILGLMILLGALGIVWDVLSNNQPGELLYKLFLYLSISIFIAGFVFSVLHLTKYKKKTLAIIALILSVLLLAFFINNFAQRYALEKSVENLNAFIEEETEKSEIVTQLLIESGYEVVFIEHTGPINTAQTIITLSEDLDEQILQTFSILASVYETSENYAVGIVDEKQTCYYSTSSEDYNTYQENKVLRDAKASMECA